MQKLLVVLFGVFSYAVGLAGLSYFFLFMGSWDFLPLHVDSKTPGPLGIALVIDVLVMVLFGIQHSVMARPGFKRAWTRIIPPPIERSVYVLLSGVLMFLICVAWQPIAGTIWNVENSVLRLILIVLHVSGWVIAVLATFLINHFELMGLQQVYFHYKETPEPSPIFTDRFFYKFVRHPLQFGILMGLWFAPTMTASHLLLSSLMTIYIFIGLNLEERNLAEALGEEYEAYRSRVRMLIPFPKGSKA